MATTITPLKTILQSEGPLVYYDEGFMNVLELHMPYLRGNGSNDLNVEPKVAQRFNHDFYGLLRYMGVPPQHWFGVLRVNKLSTPVDYTYEILTIAIPDFAYIEKLRQTYATIQKIR